MAIERFYRHGPDTGDWGSKYTRYDLVQVLGYTALKAHVRFINYDLDSTVAQHNLLKRSQLKKIRIEISDQEQALNIIKGSVYRKKSEPGVMNVYGVSIDDGKVYLLKEFTGKGFQKEAETYTNNLNSME